MPLHTLGAWVTIVAILLSLVGLIAVHVLPAGLNPMRDPVSQYHLTRYRPVILVSTLLAAVAGVAAIPVVGDLFGPGATISIVLLVRSPPRERSSRS